jgi:hypothetical protein
LNAGLDARCFPWPPPEALRQFERPEARPEVTISDYQLGSTLTGADLIDQIRTVTGRVGKLNLSVTPEPLRGIPDGTVRGCESKCTLKGEWGDRMSDPALQAPICASTKSQGSLRPNLTDYAAQASAFSWEAVQRELFERADGKANMAQVAIDRPAELAPGRLAVRCVGADGRTTELSYEALLRLANRFANLLRSRGVARGEVIACLTGRCPELFAAVLGTLKCGAVFSPLFSAFGPEPIRSRLALSSATVLITTQRLYERKVAGLRAELPTLQTVFVIRDSR